MSVSDFGLPLLHGIWGIWDEVAIYGGLLIIVLALVALSWRVGRRRRQRRDKGGT